MKSGVVLVDKRAGMTSAQVVARVKRSLKADRVGHAGTLDPDATGLLVCLVQGATRLASIAAAGTKVYTGTIRLGVTTSTDDMAGDILTRHEGSMPTSEVVVAAAERFVGAIEQTPPRVSAVKIQGKRAYALARDGAEFELRVRQVIVDRFVLQCLQPDLYRYEVECSPGTYVRSLARDLGEVLGCGGAIQELRRESSGSLRAADGVPVDDVSWDSVRDWKMLFPEMPIVPVGEGLAKDLLNGRAAALPHAAVLLNSVTPRPSRVIYAEHMEGASLGLLDVHADGSVGFFLNIGRSL